MPRDLLKSESRVQLDSFLTHHTLPVDITVAFIEGIQESFARLIKVTVRIEDLQNALCITGRRFTSNDDRNAKAVYQLYEWDNLNKVRIVL